MKSNVVLRVSGYNINRFLRRIIKNNINIFDLCHISNKEINITVSISNLEKIDKIKGTYEIQIIKYVGKQKIKKDIKKNLILIFSLVFSLLVILTMSNFIFDIKIYHNNSELKKQILTELSYNGIKPGSFRKTFDEISSIKQFILNKYKDSIEWLEITRVGTTYKVLVEERVINKERDIKSPQNIIASKSGIIKKIYAKSGVIVKNIDDYVSSGEVIVSGNVYLNENLKSVVHADAKVYAETWYTVKLNFPLYYREENYTGNIKTVFNLRVFNNDFNLFNFSKFKNYNSKDLILYKNSILPISFMIQKQKEVNLIENIYNKESATNAGIIYATKKVQDTLNEEEYIISKKVLKNVEKHSTIYMEIFFKVYEDITSSENISPLEENI